jgi:hypothetical protein
MLTRSNNSEWVLVMRVNLQAAGLWDIVELGTDDYREDRNTLAELLCAIPEEMQVGLARKESATAAWEAIRAIRMGGDKIKEANTDRLRREFSNLEIKPGECVEDFALCVSAMANQLRALGDEITEKEEIKKLLHSVPDYLEQVAISIEALLDLNSMSIEVATGHLRVVEARKKNSGEAKEGHLLLTEEEWMTRLKAREGESSNSNRGGRGPGRGKQGGRGGGGSRRSEAGDSSEDGPRRSKPTDVCRACGKLGHWARECRSKKKKAQAQAFPQSTGGGARALRVGAPRGGTDEGDLGGDGSSASSVRVPQAGTDRGVLGGGGVLDGGGARASGQGAPGGEEGHRPDR